jgi:hypothetical protein
MGGSIGEEKEKISTRDDEAQEESYVVRNRLRTSILDLEWWRMWSHTGQVAWCLFLYR